MNMSLVLRLPCEMHPCRSPSHVPRLPTLSKLLHNPHALLTFGKEQNPQHLRCKSVSFLHFSFQNLFRATTACTSQLPKVLRAWCVLYILTSNCAWHPHSVHFFDISTSESAHPKMKWFAHFDLDMCFAPQRYSLFHLIWPDGSTPAALARYFSA